MTLFDRLKEPSSWAGIGVLLQVILPAFGMTTEAAQAIAAAGSAVCGALAIVLKEKSGG